VTPVRARVPVRPGATGLSRSQRGRSIIELMISVAIGMAMTLGLFGIYLNARSGAAGTDADAAIADSGRHALAVVGRALRQAGYLRQAHHDDSWAVMPDAGFRSFDACLGGYEDVGAATPVCRNADGEPDSFRVFHAVDISETAGGPTFRTVAVDAARGRGVDCMGDEVPLPAAPETANFSVENRYFVQTHPRTGLRELYCRGGAEGRTQPVVEGVEDMVLRFAVDWADDAGGVRDMSADTLMRADEVPASAWSWSEMNGSNASVRSRRVLAVEVCLLVRSPVPEPGLERTYVDCRGATRTDRDGVARQAFRATIGARNHVGGS
jgi:type IV pilus assembly protein PilW